MRKYLIILMLTTFIGGFAFLFLITSSSLAVVINNQTNQDISGLTLSYPHLKEEITVDTIKPEDNTVLKIDPKSQATEDFTGGSLELQYTDKNGETHSEIIYEYFEEDYSGDAEITITSVHNNGTFELTIEDNLVKPQN